MTAADGRDNNTSRLNLASTLNFAQEKKTKQYSRSPAAIQQGYYVRKEGKA